MVVRFLQWDWTAVDRMVTPTATPDRVRHLAVEPRRAQGFGSLPATECALYSLLVLAHPYSANASWSSPK
jgi:hypothetical protein